MFRLSDCIETGKDGNALSLMDVLCSDEDLFEDLKRTADRTGSSTRSWTQVLSPRERMVITLRYGLGDRTPLTQREIAAELRHQPLLCLPHREKGTPGLTDSAAGLPAGELSIAELQLRLDRAAV